MEGEQGGEQTEPNNRPIAQIDFQAPHRLVQKFPRQMDVERTRCQEQHDADKPQTEDHVEYAARTRRRLRNIVILEARIHRPQAHAKARSGARDQQDDDHREQHQIGIGFEEQIGHDDQGFRQYEQRQKVHAELFTQKTPEGDG